jgi:hypothetical protein
VARECDSQEPDETRQLGPWLDACLFAACAVGFLVTYRVFNDHFDRLSRAYQMVAFGDVPFRDFFDPGYFLTLYASAFLQRLFGHNLLGEVLLNVLAMSAGATLAAVMVSRITGSRGWGLIAAILIVGAQPRPYDYDKVLFFPLGLYACWRYVDGPDRSLLFAAGVAAIAGLFRYDSGAYLFLALAATIVARHWRQPREAAKGLGIAALAAAAVLAPAAVFVQATAGIGTALNQVRTYAVREGGNGHIFEFPPFALDWHAPVVSAAGWLPGIATRQNAGAWLYLVAISLPLLAVLFHLRTRHPRNRAEIARLTAYVTLGELLTLFILRNPVIARVGALVPILAVGAAYAISGCQALLRESATSQTGRRPAYAAIVVTAGLCVLSSVSILTLSERPPSGNLQIAARLKEFRASPPSLANWPDPPYWPVVQYIRACTGPDDRVFAAWFFSELYYFTDRGFAGGMPVLFEKHWSDLRYQRESLDLLKNQSVPIILATQSKDLTAYEFLWSFINREYRRVDTPPPPAFPDIRVWVRRDRPSSGYFGETELPCFANRPRFASR